MLLYRAAFRDPVEQAPLVDCIVLICLSKSSKINVRRIKRMVLVLEMVRF